MCLRELVLEPASEKYFFQSVSGPDWLASLYRSGWFLEPQVLQQDKRGSYYAYWPALEFLRKSASDAAQKGDKATLEVTVRVIDSIPFTENPYIFKELVDIALLLPASYVADLAFTFQGWLGGQRRLLTREVPNLISKLAQNRYEDAAFRLFRSAFAVFPDTKYYETSPEKRLLPDPKYRIEEWALPEQLQTAIAGLQAEDIRLVTVISELVNDAVRFSQSDISRVGPHDTSYVWRP